MEKKVYLITVIMLSTLQTAWSQKDYFPGYIVLNNRDTLYGEIQDRNINKVRLYEKIRFRSASGKRMKLSASDLISYSVNNKIFESKWFDEHANIFRFYYTHKIGTGEKTFLRLDTKGKVSVYTKEFTDGDCSTIDEFPLFLKEGDKYFQRATQGVFGLKKKKLASYFQDCPKLVSEINQRSLKYAFEVADYYNNKCE
ncbi:hypothetical protein [Spongiivirga citrea]|uniref:Uncharacterized protein n=1 Tax=Spongiivirga citrea TaxID=1481457 RepID=A0A6M0CD63_9FLAO|nr:hypothetical protein [Spongiivirga citrea]NER15746.1 hypothetical protein [Spongiivirga citrea]